jgi:hypothetical protein
MGLHSSLQSVSHVVEQLESAGWTVADFSVTTGSDADRLHVVIDVPVPLGGDAEGGSAATPTAASFDDEGRLQVTFDPPSLVPPSLDGVATVEETTATLRDGRVLLSVHLGVVADGIEGDVTSDREGASPATSTTAESSAETDSLAAELAAVRDPSCQPYEDTPYLQRLYDRCDNFTEMQRHIDMDVSAETVRRYMIDAGVHEPASYATGDDGDADGGAVDESSPTEAETDETDADEDEADTTAGDDAGDEAVEPADPASPGDADDPMRDLRHDQLVADGLGLPSHVRLEDLADAVAESVTVYQVQKRLDLDRAQTQRLLEELDLLDLVLRHVANYPDRATAREQIAARIRQKSASQPAAAP